MNPSDPSPIVDAEDRRLHPMTLALRGIVAIPALIFLLLPVLRSPDGGAMVNLVFAVLYAAVILPWLVVRYLRFRYRVTEREIIIHSGVFTVRRRNIPIERIQNIEVERQLLQRATGTARVRIYTAGSTSAEGALDVVSVDEALRIRQAVRALQAVVENAEPDRHDRPADGNETAAASADANPSLFDMTPGQVLLSGVFRFSLLYLAITFSAVQYIEPDPERLFQWIARATGAADVVRTSPATAAAFGIMLAILFGWLTGIAVNLNRYFGYSLRLERDAQVPKLQYRHGLLTRHEGTIPVRRIQSLIVRTSPLMRQFGFFALEAQTMGADVKEEGHQVIVPFGSLADVTRVAHDVNEHMAGAGSRRFRIPDAFESVSRLTIRRAFVRYTVGLAVLITAAYFVWDAARFAAPILLVALPAAVLRWRHMGFHDGDDWLVVKRGVLRQYTWFVPLHRAQVFYRSASVFQRRLGLATLYLDTAGAATARSADLIDLEEDRARDLSERLYDRFRELYG